MKKLLVLLALCMVFSVVLVACNNNEGTEDTTTDATTDAPTTEAPTTEAPTTETPTEEPTTEAPTTEAPTTEAPTTEEPTTEEPTTEPVDPAEPVVFIDPNAIINAGGQNVSGELLNENGVDFARLTITGDDCQRWVIDNAGLTDVPNFLTFVYRTNTAVNGEMFIGSQGGPTGQGDHIALDWNEDGNWHIMVIDLANAGITSFADGKLNYLRWDPMAGVPAEGEYIDIQYIGIFNTATYAYDAFFSTIATIVPAADMAASIPGSPGVTGAVLSANGTYVTIDTIGQGDPYYQLPMLNGKGIAAKYVAIKYRSTSTHTKSEMFVGSGAGPSGQGDNIQFDLTCDGNWNLAIVDLSAASAVVDGVVNYLRWDPFAGAADATIDMAYIGLFATEADALAYDAALADIYRNAPKHVDEVISLGVRDGGPFTPGDGSVKKFGQKLTLGETFLKNVTIAGLATYADGNVNTWSFKVWKWNTDYATTVAADPAFVLEGENHTDNADFVANIPAELLLNGEVYYEIEYLSGSAAFTGWTAKDVPEIAVTYSQGNQVEGGYAASITVGVEIVRPANGSLEFPLNVTETLDAVAGLEVGAATEEKYYTTGVVTEIGQGGSYYKNVYFTDGVNTMLIYTLNPIEGMPELHVGDTITVHGFIKNYNEVIEFASNNGEYVFIVAHEPSVLVVDPRDLAEGAITGHMTHIVTEADEGHYPMIAAAGLTSGAMLHQGSIYLGEFNLAEYSKLVIYYATDWGDGTQAGLAAAKEQGFGRLGISAADCNGLLNPTEDKVFLANQYTPDGGWKITAQEITLGIDYSGSVYVSADFLGGQFIIIDRVEFVY